MAAFTANGQQYKNVKIGQSPKMRRGLCEPSISINRSNPDNIVAGAILNNVFYSNDGGHSWQWDTLSSSYGVWGDPVIVSDFQGNQYFFHLSDPTGENWSSEEILDRIVVQRSEDGGASWNDGGYMGLDHPKDQDKQWATVDPENNKLYATWTQFDKYGSPNPEDRTNILFSSSNDKGDSWSQAVVISEVSGNCLDSDSTTEGAVPTVNIDGNVYVAWSNNHKIYFDRVTPQGNHLEEDKIIADHHGGWDLKVPGLMRANGMPVTIADISEGPHRGRIYVSWVDDREGNYDVWVINSDDNGETWSEPLRINDDDSEKDQFFHQMESDPKTGYLYTVFYDRRNTEGIDTEVYMAYSKDGGESWTNEKISEKPFTNNPMVFFGDYNDIDAFDGHVRPIWTRMEDDGSMSIYTAIINFDKD